MPELAVIELFAWPALAAGFAALWLGRRAGLRAYPAAFAALALALWLGSAPAGANRAMLAGLGQVALWSAALAVPAGLYAWLIAKARRKARERTDP